MRKLKTSHMLWVILAIVIIIVLGMLLYVSQVDYMLAGMTSSTMHEIANHDIAFVENTLDRSWSNLFDIVKRLQIKRLSSIAGLQKQLNVERTGSTFQNLYLVDPNGKVYSGAYLIKSNFGLPAVHDIIARRPRTVRRCKWDNYRVDDQQDIIAYSVSTTPFEVDGVTFIGIIGQTNIQDVRENMSLSSFGGRGLSYVVDADGNYIVNESDTSGIIIQENLFSQMKNATFLHGFSMKRLRDDLSSSGKAACSFTINGRSFMLCMHHFNSADWYLAVLVPSDVFATEERKFTLLTGAMLVLVLLLVAIVLLVSLRAWRTTLKARASAAAESEFLSRMSHEIRTPLNALIGLHYLMKKDLNDSDKLSGYLDQSQSTSQYLLSLINDILDISKFRQNKAVFAREPFSLTETTKLVQTMIKDKMDERDITFTVSCNLPHPCVIGDVMRLKQVLLNILSNAAKFTPRGGHVEMELSQEPGANSEVVTKISITDNGIGMSDEFQQRVFDSFSQEKRPESANSQGTGLGMAISSLIMKQMGGRLTVASKLGKGSRFTVIFPAKLCVGAFAPKHDPTPVQTGVDKLRVLIAEDNEMNAQILANILEKEGCTSAVAENGLRAVEIFRDSQPGEFSMVLMDMQMPVMDGYEAAKEIRSLGRTDALTVPIIACTANTTQEDRSRADKSGMNGFLAKPIDVNELFKIMSSCGRRGERK